MLRTDLTLHFQQCPFEEHATERLFLRFRQRFEQHFSLLLDGYDEQQCFHEVPYKEVFEFIGITRPRRRCFKKQLSNDNASASEGESRRDNGRKVHEYVHVKDRSVVVIERIPLQDRNK